MADNNTTTNQQTAERRQQQRRWRQLGGGAAATAARQQRTAQWRKAMDGVTARAMAIDGTGQEGGTARGRREAMRQPSGQEVPPSMIQFLSCDTNLCESVYINL